MAAPLKLTRTHRILVGLVVTGALVIAAIGFAGSYSAVRALAERQGFGRFALVFPIGIDAGICVLLALDLLLTWIRIPFPLLRQTAWLLTAATIAFNGAAAWPDPLGVGMHAVIPVLFVVTVEAARHAVGRIADITADKHMEGVRLTRWILSPLPTFLLWRRMKLWELRSYEQTIRLEQERLIYQARLRSRFGRSWRRRAPIESLMPLRLARYGVPLAETAPAGLAAAGIEPVLLPPGPSPTPAELERPSPRPATTDAARPDDTRAVADEPAPHPAHTDVLSPWFVPPHKDRDGGAPQQPDGSYEAYEQAAQGEPGAPYGPAARQRYAGPDQAAARAPHDPHDPRQPAPGAPEPEHPAAAETTGETPIPYPQGGAEPAAAAFHVPAGPGRTRPLGGNPAPVPGRQAESHPDGQPEPTGFDEPEVFEPPAEEPQASGLPEDLTRKEAFYRAFCKYVAERMDYPNARQFGLYLLDLYGVTGQAGGPLTEGTLRPYLREFRTRHQQEMDAGAEHIA